MAYGAEFARVLELADLTTARLDPGSMRWMWGQALLVWSLSELDLFLGEDRYLPFCLAYCRRHAAHPPRIAESDTCAPALAAWALYRRTGDWGCRALAEAGARYVREEPRLHGEAVNHLGHSLVGKLYPKSVWVDSLVMFGLFAARYAIDTGDRGLLDFAARQPALYASLLQDPDTGLFHHSWRAEPPGHYPRGPVFWGRGNGWAAVVLPMILDLLPEGRPERAGIARILRRLSEALLELRRSDGWWDTLLCPGGGAYRGAYRESSATALVAAGWMRALRSGHLDERYRGPALSSFSALVSNLGPPGSPPSMGEISAPTIPLPLFPALGYALVPKARDLSYGLAALFLAAIEREKLMTE